MGLALAITDFAAVSRPGRWFERIGALSLAALISIIYLHTKEFSFFQASFTLEVAVAGLLGGQTLWRFRGTEHARQLASLFGTGVFLFAVAFALWNIDNELCSHLRSARVGVPLALKGILEFHALWHIFSGLGLYAVIVFGVFARELSRGRSVKLRGGFVGLFPRVELEPDVEEELSFMAVKVEDTMDTMSLTEKISEPVSEPQLPGLDSDHLVIISGTVASGLRIRQSRHRSVASDGCKLGKPLGGGLTRSSSLVDLTRI